MLYTPNRIAINAYALPDSTYMVDFICGAKGPKGDWPASGPLVFAICCLTGIFSFWPSSRKISDRAQRCIGLLA